MHRSEVSRRRFLGVTAGVAAGTAVPLFVPRLLADEPKNEKLRLAAIGVGGRGTAIAQEAAELGEMVACCDVDSGNAERFAAAREKAGSTCKKYVDYREMLDAEKDLDAVTIGTPDHWHVKIAIDCMKAGLHVYCEKPLTLTIEEGEIVKQAVKKYGKVFQVGTQQRSEYDGRFLKAVAIAHSGRLGSKLRAISSVGKGASRAKDKSKPYGPFETSEIPAELNWDLWLGQAPKVPYCEQRVGWDFRWWFEYSGGQVTDWGVHHTDIAFWALSGDQGHIASAEGTATPMFVELDKSRDFLLGKIAPEDMPLAYNVAHSFDVNLTLTTGHTINLISGPNELIIEGEAGKIRVNRGGLTGKPVEEIDSDPQAKAEIEELMAKLYGGHLPASKLGHMQNFFDCVKQGGQPVANVADHVRAVNACHVANIALLMGKKVEFDAEAGRFADETANGLLARKRRPEYDITL